MSRPKDKKRFTVRISLFLFIFTVLIVSGGITIGIWAILWNIPQLNQNVSTEFWYFVLVLMFTVLLGSLFTYVFSKIWLKSTTELSQAAKEVSRGNFRVKVSDKGHRGEFGDMIRSFNHMAEELSHLEIFRQDFINYFSHEFKTPIVSIRGFARQLEDPKLPAKTRREYLDIIVHECDRLTRLATNILLLSRFENQQIVAEATTFSLDEQIRSCILLLEKEWAEKNLDLVIELEEVPYNTNEEMLALLWTNLISNAIKYNRPGGRLEVLCTQDAKGVHVTVSDQGCGMSEEVISHIFDKFYQGDASHTTPGNGLGLALVKRILELCGGTVQVSSREGEGSVFSVTLPKTV